MKNKYFGLLILSLVMISCSSTISTAKKEYKIVQTSKLKSNWNFNSKEWLLKKDTLIGTGGPMHWGVIKSKKKLSKNYEIEFRVNMTKGSLFEVMLNIDKEQYIRTYLYNIDQNIVIGKGVYKEGSDEYEKRGGPTLFNKPMKLENDKWYSVKIRVTNNQLYFSVNNEKTLECSIEKSNLSQQGKLGFLTDGEIKVIDLKIKSIE
ncbi:family 16 glycoside hydrolase [Flavobacterium sp. PS2]|uniref:family 16 glycoside hydrolase n=1 Tax=Flavobacterium sp. PS2 TaxID=3384157 RepID=UPI00390CA356